MAGKKTTASGETPTGKEIRLASVGTIRSFSSATDSANETIDDARKELGDAKDVAIKGHLFIAAFKAAKDLHDAMQAAKNPSIAAEKLAKWLANFDHYRKHFKLDELANLQGRMFGVGEIGGAESRAGDEPPREPDEDGQPDVRPRHLRQPGASAASPEPGGAAQAVRDLASKAGATPRGDEDQLKGLGKGPDEKPSGKLN